eukprot:6432673-Pyramimonas_sp.AAC.1
MGPPPSGCRPSPSAGARRGTARSLSCSSLSARSPRGTSRTPPPGRPARSAGRTAARPSACAAGSARCASPSPWPS